MKTRSIYDSVSVIVVNWNSGTWLARCFAALRQQTIRDFEVIVVDNASLDDSIAQAMPLLPHALLLRQVRNLGFAAANNLAVRHASGRWIALLNPDAIPAPDWLECLLIAAAAYPEFGFFGSRQLMASTPNFLDGIGDAFHVSGLAWRLGYGKSASEARNEVIEIFSPCAAAALYRRDLFDAAGGFDERFFCYLEDVDLGFRLRLTGQRALYVPNAVVHHAGSASSGRHSNFTVYHSQRNLAWVFFKNMPLPLLLIYLPAHLVLHLYAIIYFALRGQVGTVLKAKWDALRDLRIVLNQRAVLQAKRTISTAHLLKYMARGWPRRRRIV